MLDISLIRHNPEKVHAGLGKRGVHVDLSAFLRLDEKLRATRVKIEKLRAERNKLSDEIARARHRGDNFAELLPATRTLGTQLTDLETEFTALEGEHREFLDSLPNLTDDDIVPGGKESNEVIKLIREKPTFSFATRDHVELAEQLQLVDYQRGAKLAGNGFWVYRGNGALLEWALLNYFVDTHRRNDYEFILPPHILDYEAGYVAGQFPKFIDDVFMLPQKGDSPQQFLLPTAETALINLHRGETLSVTDLPKKYFAYTPCYRKESGGYRSTERGTLRGHQFQKIEMFQFVKPADSDAVFNDMLQQAEQLMLELGLHYRVTRLAAEDMTASMARTYDIEVWLPSIDTYTEVSSVSNARDYQARRGNIRFQDTTDLGRSKPSLVHTLNASGLATSRLLPAILEQYQQEDGSVIVPEVLRKYGLPAVLTRP